MTFICWIALWLYTFKLSCKLSSKYMNHNEGFCSECDRAVTVKGWRKAFGWMVRICHYLAWRVGPGEAEQHSDRWGAQLVFNLWIRYCNIHTQTVAERYQGGYQRAHTHLQIKIYDKSLILCIFFIVYFWYLCSVDLHTAAVNHFVASQDYQLTYGTRSPHAQRTQDSSHARLFSTCSSIFLT